MYKLALICIFVACASGEPTKTVNSTVGEVIGKVEAKYITYLGIPYAKVNPKNPFGNSIVYPKFDIAYNASNSSMACPQSKYQNSTTIDCLQLNIYAPLTANETNKAPILVWFHGGEFEYGNGGQYGGQHLVTKGILVITVNYRLGPYGFLCLDDPTVPGNQGLKDQIEALRWVKKNIVAFGGDPNNITIAGESFGGAGVDLHLYSEYEKLFDKAIVQSGSIFHKGFFVKPDYQAAVKIAKDLGHKVNNTKEAIKALAGADALAVVKAAERLHLKLGVCKEKNFKDVKNFVSSDPIHLDKPNKINNTKIMIGYTSMEYVRSYANKDESFWKENNNVINVVLKKYFNSSIKEVKVLGNLIKKFYLGNKAIDSKSLIGLSEFASDLLINHPVERSINNYLQANENATVYKYLFSYTGGSPFKSIPGAGAAHTEELNYLFEWQTPIETERVAVNTESQKEVRKTMTTLWANFVKHGNPTPKDMPELTTWTPVKGIARPYLNIDETLTMADDVYSKRMAFWDMACPVYEKYSQVYVNPESSKKSSEATSKATTPKGAKPNGATRLDTHSMYLSLYSAILVYICFSNKI